MNSSGSFFLIGTDKDAAFRAGSRPPIGMRAALCCCAAAPQMPNARRAHTAIHFVILLDKSALPFRRFHDTDDQNQPIG